MFMVCRGTTHGLLTCHHLGSVINANSTHTTIAIEYDNGTDWQALHIPHTPSPATITVGPNIYEASRNLDVLAWDNRTAVSDYIYTLHCELPSDKAANATCTNSYGPLLGVLIQCRAGYSYTSTEYETQAYTYSGRGSYSGGVETITHKFGVGPVETNVPSWCSDTSYSPLEGYTTGFQAEPTDIAMYQVVITAGEEKLSATIKASATQETATPTSEQASTGTATPASMGAAAHLAKGGQLMVGLGAVAAFLV